MNSKIKIQLTAIKTDLNKLIYTHKTHEKETEIQERLNKKANQWTVLFTALTSTALIGDVFVSCNLSLITALLSFAALALALYQYAFKHGEQAINHRQTAKQLIPIRNKYNHFIADIKTDNLSIGEIISKRDQLSEQAHLIYELAPQTSKEAYREAKNEVEAGD